MHQALSCRTAKAKAATRTKAAPQAVTKGNSRGAVKSEKQQQLQVQEERTVAPMPHNTIGQNAILKSLRVLQEAVSKWEKLRRHDTNAEERLQLITTVLGQVRAADWCWPDTLLPSRYIHHLLSTAG